MKCRCALVLMFVVTSSASTTAEDPSHRVVTPEQYGAVGDGHTDVTVTGPKLRWHPDKTGVLPPDPLSFDLSTERASRIQGR